MSPEDIFTVMEHVLQLKRVKRAGWENKGIWESESVADHSYGTAMLALLLAKESGLDETRMLKLALLHDLGEAVVGDIVIEHEDENARRGKHDAEREALKDILASDTELMQLAHEYIDQSSPEAQLVRDADKLEMIYQALQYESKAEPEELDEFWETARARVKSSLGKKILADLEKRRMPRNLF